MNNETLKIMTYYENSIVDGEGIRDVIFVAGCPHKCKGCHNPESWNIENGYEINIDKLFNKIVNNEFSDITFSGGDPFLQVNPLITLAKRIKETTNKNIWCYTGYIFEELIQDKQKLELLQYIDILVDGRFIEELKDLNLKFKGSSNQRIIDCKESLKQNKAILYEI